METNRVPVSIYLTAELKAWLDDTARADGRSLSSVIVRKLEAEHRGGRAVVAERRISAPARAGRQVDIAEAIADAVKRGPAKPGRPAKGK